MLLLGVRGRKTGVKIWVANNVIGLNDTNGKPTITCQPSNPAGLEINS